MQQEQELSLLEAPALISQSIISRLYPGSPRPWDLELVDREGKRQVYRTLIERAGRGGHVTFLERLDGGKEPPMFSQYQRLRIAQLSSGYPHIVRARAI